MLQDDATPPKKKRANGLVAASCAGVLAVYTAGYVRTKSAVDRFEAQAAERRAARPDPDRVVGYVYGSRAAMRTEAATAAPTEGAPERSQPEVFERLTPPSPPPQAFAPEAPAPSITPRPETAVAAEPAPQGSTPPAAISVQIAPQPVTITPPSTAEAAPVAAAKLPAPPPEPPVPAAPEPKWKDGAYLGWGTSRHGNIQAEVIVENGRILSATIAQCRTRYSCSVIDRLPPQVAQRQSPDVDYVSGATQSANAFYFAVVDALSKAH